MKKKLLHYHLNIMNKEKFSVFHVEQNTVQKSCISFHFGKLFLLKKDTLGIYYDLFDLALPSLKYHALISVTPIRYGAIQKWRHDNDVIFEWQWSGDVALKLSNNFTNYSKASDAPSPLPLPRGSLRYQQYCQFKLTTIPTQ